MRYLVFLAAMGAAACAGGSKSTSGPSLPIPSTKATSEMAEGDLDLRRVAVAAAGYYKQIASAARLGFFGVFIDQLEVPRVTDEVVRRYAFVLKPRMVCTATVVVPAGSRAPVAPPAGTPQNCRIEGADAGFTLNAFRRVADTVYVGGNSSEVRGGSPVSNDMCLVMVWRDTAWTGAGKRGVSSRSCGK
jgi:hypothetical protein